MRVTLAGLLAICVAASFAPSALSQQSPYAGVSVHPVFENTAPVYRAEARLDTYNGQKPVQVAQVLKGNVTAVQQKPAANGPTVSQGGGGLVAGQVRSMTSGMGLGEVQVSIPQIAFEETSNAKGDFRLPKLPDKPTIVRFAKPGFVPKTLTLDADWQADGRKLLVSLREIHNTIVLDQEIRHLGDNSFSPVSAGAQKFQRQAGSPKLVRQFITPEGNGPVYLEIGSVIGLDTQAAHTLGQSAFHRTSSPMTVKVNGQLLSNIGANGDAQRIVVPRQLLLAGNLNVLEIQTGYQVPDGTYIDYDDMELMLLTLEY